MREMGFEGTLYNGQGTKQWIGAGYELVEETEDAAPSPPTCVSSDICADVALGTNGGISLEQESSANNKAGLCAAVVIPTLLVSSML